MKARQCSFVSKRYFIQDMSVQCDNRCDYSLSERISRHLSICAVDANTIITFLLFLTGPDRHHQSIAVLQQYASPLQDSTGINTFTRYRKSAKRRKRRQGIFADNLGCYLSAQENWCFGHHSDQGIIDFAATASIKGSIAG